MYMMGKKGLFSWDWVFRSRETSKWGLGFRQQSPSLSGKPALTERLYWWKYLIFSPIHLMQRSPVHCNGLIAELGNTWMEKLYTPESRLCLLGQGVRYCRMLTSSPVPPEDRRCSSFQACAFSPLWLHYQGTLLTCGTGRGVPFSSLTRMLTELRLCCKGTACGQMLGTGTGLGLQQLSCWSSGKSFSQNRRVLKACFTSPVVTKLHSILILMDCPASWWFPGRAAQWMCLGVV